MLSERIAVARVDTQPVEAGPRSQTGVTLSRLQHFVRLKTRLRERFERLEASTVVWTSISPDVAGHLRDLLFVLPQIRGFEEVVAVVHRGNFDKVFRSPLTRFTAPKLVASVSKFVFLTRDLSDACSPWIPPDQRYVVPNTIDQEILFSSEELAAKRAERKSRQSLEILFLSNMIRSKGFLDVIEALGILINQGVRATLKMAGAWPDLSEKEGLFRRLEQLGISDAVDHEGPVYERRRVKELYRSADVLALPSYYPNEAQPLAIIEALNAGLPVVATRHGGIPEMIEDGVEGYLVPKRNPEALADAMKNMLAIGRWLKLSDNARTRFERAFSPSVIVEQWMGLLRRHKEEIDR